MRLLKLIAATALLTGNVALANGMHANLTPEQRTQMAAAHEKMAACLRSNRSLDDCRSEMHKAWESVVGEKGCACSGGHGDCGDKGCHCSGHDSDDKD